MTFASRSTHQPLAVFGLLLTLFTGSANAESDAPVIATGMQVSFSYTLSVDGDVTESNVDGEPLVYTQGGGQILEALETELAGMHVGEKKVVQLSPAQGYGEINQEAFQELPIDQVPESARQVGALLQAEGIPGPIRVAEVREDAVVLDFNHPLAGKALTFDITIVDIQPAPAASAN
jgi:FKBP-type peptidyl-prolyl cis-trans isomerase 2